jgi:hypothetical protein
MNASEISFGIEIETYLPRDATPIGRYHAGVQVPWLPAGWKAEHDGSIRTPSYRKAQCEFVSPVLKGAEGIKQVVAAVKEIKARGAGVNESCGIHITLTFPAGNAAALERLVHIVANHEKAIYATTGTKRLDGSLLERCIRAAQLATRAPLAMLGLWRSPAKLIAVKRGNPLCLAETPRGYYLGSLLAGLPGDAHPLRDDVALVFTGGRAGAEMVAREAGDAIEV